jgi:3-hydroxyacyl-CoA dehydrogenase / enoyl-CoA hydratase / 3-hydroxybutyryl-CoA epimerase
MAPVVGAARWLDPDGIVHVTFDRPGDSVNLLTSATLQWLGGLLDEIRGREDVRGLLFRSAKRGMFIAGMDVEEITSFSDAHRAAESARLGQSVFQKIAELPFASAAAINGTCLGGATELVMACTFRLAASEDAVRIGLPEVQLGIIPGFGGTQRLPRRIGLLPSLPLILTGKRVDPRKALVLGLVDRVVPAAYLEREALALLKQAAADPARASRLVRRGRPVSQRLIESVSPLRRIVIARAARETARKVRRQDYPAPFRALEAVEAAFSMPLPQGLDMEARIVGELIPTQTSKNLIWLFKSQTALKKDGGGVTAPPRTVRRAAVLGAGIMGGGIAQLIADRGVPVRVKDIRSDALLTAMRTARKVWDDRVRRRRMSPREATQRMAFLSPTLDDSGLARVDLVLEAVVEDLAVKQRVLATVEERVSERCVFASNTSSLPISDIAARALRPERVVGLHFFNPVHRMPLVEIIAGLRTSPEALATVHAFAIKLGKVPVVVRDSPGFLVNRILMLYLNEALRLLAEGIRIESADPAMTRFGMPMGPFELLDQVGLDTALHVAGVLEAAFGKRIGGSAQVLRAMVDAGRLGAKNGKGFYRYRKGRRAGPDKAVYGLAGVTSPKELPPETLQERMVLAMVNEAVVCLEDGVVREPRDVDLGMVMGTGFPPHRGGLLRYADAMGIAVLADRLSRLADGQGERYRPAGLLQEMVRHQQRFYPT